LGESFLFLSGLTSGFGSSENFDGCLMDGDSSSNEPLLLSELKDGEGSSENFEGVLTGGEVLSGLKLPSSEGFETPRPTPSPLPGLIGISVVFDP